MGEYLLVECYGIDLKNYKMEKTIEWVRIHLKKFVCELEPEFILKKLDKNIDTS